MSVSPEQAIAARNLLNWSQMNLAKAAGLDLAAVIDFERCRGETSVATVELTRAALEKAGIPFVKGQVTLGQ